MKLKKYYLAIFLVLISIDAMAQDKNIYKPIIIQTGLKDATSLYAAPTGLLYITETGKNRVLVVSSNGQRVDSLGNTGVGNYQFDTPTDVDATNGLKIYIADYNNHRIQIYDRHFQYLSTINKSNEFDQDVDYEPLKLCVNNRGELFFYDDNSGDIIKFNSRGEFDQRFVAITDKITGAPSVMVPIDDRIYIGDPSQGVIHIISNDGRYIGFLGGVKNVAGFAKGAQHLWAFMPGIIKVFTNNGELIKVLNVEKTKNAMGIAIIANKIFLLTANKLLYLKENSIELLNIH